MYRRREGEDIMFGCGGESRLAACDSCGRVEDAQGETQILEDKIYEVQETVAHEIATLPEQIPKITVIEMIAFAFDELEDRDGNNIGMSVSGFVRECGLNVEL
jgi:hypothetical protein